MVSGDLGGSKGFCANSQFSWRIFLGTVSHKNEEKKSGDKIREKNPAVQK